MVKRPVTPKADSELLVEYPIADRLDGWFFRVREISVGAYLVEGSDRFGRIVSRTGGDAEQLLAQCVLDAGTIQNRIR